MQDDARTRRARRFGSAASHGRQSRAPASSRSSRTAWSARGTASATAFGASRRPAPSASDSIRCGASNTTWVGGACAQRVRPRACALAAARRRESRRTRQPAAWRRRPPIQRGRARCSRPGIGTTRYTCRDRAAATERRAGIAHRRRAGVADVGHALARVPAGRARRRRRRARCAQCTRDQRLGRSRNGAAARRCGACLSQAIGVDDREHVQRAQRSGRLDCRSASRRHERRRGILAGPAGGRRRAAVERASILTTDETSGVWTTVTTRPRPRLLGRRSPKRARSVIWLLTGLVLVRAQLSRRARARARGGEVDLVMREPRRHARCSSRCGCADDRFGGAAASIGAAKRQRLRLRRAPLPAPARAAAAVPVRRRRDRRRSDRVAARSLRRRLAKTRPNATAQRRDHYRSVTMLEQRIQQQFFDAAPT